MHLIDSHTHAHYHDFNGDRAEIIQRALAQNTQMITIGTDYESSQAAIALAHQHKGDIFATVGLHPNDIHSATLDELDNFKTLITQHADIVVGVGETGLDYYRLSGSPEEKERIKNEQKLYFKTFIKIAKQTQLPLIIHTRGTQENPFDATEDMITILSEENYFFGDVHCFGGSLEQAQRLAEKDMYIGITGIVTFKNAHLLQDIVRKIPLEQILIETDAPFLTPEPHRGERNEPSYVRFVAEKIAALKNIDFETVAKQTTQNTKDLFGF